MPTRIAWDQLANPVYAADAWSVKDVCAVDRGDGLLVFFSAFYADGPETRCQVVGVRTADLRTFSPPVLAWDGRADGHRGLCSPDVTRHDGRYYLTFNSWGDDPARPNQLYYAVSDDLERWSGPRPLAGNLTAGRRAIDAAIAFVGGRVLLLWKGALADGQSAAGMRGRVHVTQVAVGDDLYGPFRHVGAGVPTFTLADGTPSPRTHENYQFLRWQGGWHVLCTDYPPHRPVLYRLAGDGQRPDDFLHWVDGRELDIPEEAFNTAHRANAAALLDRTAADGHWYLLYAGNTENETFARRGHNRLGVARSRDLLHWQVPPGPDQTGG